MRRFGPVLDVRGGLGNAAKAELHEFKQRQAVNNPEGVPTGEKRPIAAWLAILFSRVFSRDKWPAWPWLQVSIRFANPKAAEVTTTFYSCVVQVV